MYYYIIMLLLIALDQLTKYLAVAYLQPIDTLPIIEGVIHLTYVENTGAAFSMLSGNQLFLKGVTIVAITIMMFVFRKLLSKPEEDWIKACFVLIISGGIGNLIDRLRLDYVIDFIDFRLINFAIFNGADSFVSVGTALLFYVVFFGKTKAF